MEKVYNLGEICSIRLGKTPSTQKKEYWCSHKEKCDCVNWYTGKDITQGNLETERKITSLAVKENKQPLTTINSLLFFHMECLPFYLGVSGFSCNQIISILEPDLNLINPNYLYYLLLANQKKLRNLRTGTAQLFTKQSSLTCFPVSLPSLSEQNQILQKFQIVYNKLFKSEVIYNDFLLKMVKNFLELGDLLFLKYQDSTIKIKDHFQLVRGKTPPTKNPEYYENGTIKWINSGVLTNLYFLTDKTLPTNYITEKARKECKLKFAQYNSVLFSHVNLDKTKMVWNQTSDYLLGDNILNFTSESVLKNAALFFGMRTANFSPYSSLSVINHIRGFDLINLKINWVSDPEKQKIFFTILSSKLAKIKDLHSQIKDLHSQIKDLLLLKYFGKKRKN